MSFEEELLSLTLVEKNDNELAIKEEPLLEKMQVEEQHPGITIVLVGVDKLNFPIDFLTLGMEEDRKFSSIGRPSIAASQVWIDAKHGEMTFLIDKEKVKFDLHQTMPLTDEERRMCMRIESSLPPFVEHAPILFQEDTLQRFGLESNSLSTNELAFELLSHIMKAEKFILASDEDDVGVLTMMDERPTQSSWNSPKSLVGL